MPNTVPSSSNADTEPCAYLPKILIQLDPDKQASSFDAVVAADSGVDQLLTYSLVEPSDVESLVHGAIFTRGVNELQNTAIFVGGSDVSRSEAILERVQASFFGPMRVSVMMDANGSNTTAAAAVLAAKRHLSLDGLPAIVLAGTGPVGQRAALLLALSGCHVRVASRSIERATEVCQRLSEGRETTIGGRLQPVVADGDKSTSASTEGCAIVIAAGAAGVPLLSEKVRTSQSDLRLAIDLNAVPPLGIAGTQGTDNAEVRQGVTCYGALGVGGTKMKIHREAIRRLFTQNDLWLDAEEIFRIGCELIA